MKPSVRHTRAQNEQIDQLSIILPSPVNVLLMTLLEMAVYDRLPAELLYNALRTNERTNTDSILAASFQSIFLLIAAVWLFVFSFRSVIIDQRRGKAKSIQTKHRLVEGDLFWKKRRVRRARIYSNPKVIYWSWFNRLCSSTNPWASDINRSVAIWKKRKFKITEVGDQIQSSTSRRWCNSRGFRNETQWDRQANPNDAGNRLSRNGRI